MSAPFSFDEVVTYCDRRGFVFPTSEIYGGFSATYDFGPLGALLLRNIRETWIRELAQLRRNVVLFDGAIIGNPKVWIASGHVDRFHDPAVHDLVTGVRYRADHLVEAKLKRDVADLSPSELQALIEEHDVRSPDGNPLSRVELSSLMVATTIGGRETFLRGETCQNIFVQYLNIARSTRMSPPFGVVQIGKVYRNEVTGRQFVLRTREFEQVEFEYFVDPKDSVDWYSRWKAEFISILHHSFGLPEEKLRYRSLSDAEKPHYARHAADLEFQQPNGEWLELSPMNHRGDWDLTRHSEHSGKELSAFSASENRRFIPEVIETSFGLGRLLFAILVNGLVREDVSGEDDARVVLRIPRRLAPYRAAILPLSRKSHLIELAERLHRELSSDFFVDVDTSSASIGKRYRRQDEIGTPHCITIDFDTATQDSVTIRDRDSMRQERVAIDRVRDYMK